MMMISDNLTTAIEDCDLESADQRHAAVLDFLEDNPQIGYLHHGKPTDLTPTGITDLLATLSNLRIEFGENRTTKLVDRTLIEELERQISICCKFNNFNEGIATLFDLGKIEVAEGIIVDKLDRTEYSLADYTEKLDLIEIFADNCALDLLDRYINRVSADRSRGILRIYQFTHAVNTANDSDRRLWYWNNQVESLVTSEAERRLALLESKGFDSYMFEMGKMLLLSGRVQDRTKRAIISDSFASELIKVTESEGLNIEDVLDRLIYTTIPILTQDEGQENNWNIKDFLPESLVWLDIFMNMEKEGVDLGKLQTSFNISKLIFDKVGDILQIIDMHLTLQRDPKDIEHLVSWLQKITTYGRDKTNKICSPKFYANITLNSMGHFLDNLETIQKEVNLWLRAKIQTDLQAPLSHVINIAEYYEGTKQERIKLVFDELGISYSESDLNESRVLDLLAERALMMLDEIRSNFDANAITKEQCLRLAEPILGITREVAKVLGLRKELLPRLNAYISSEALEYEV